ncbi:hypothetical protein [Mongoliibacter ruber]|uniref:Cellulase (Glycosyl hydrolase family 5) n=1 Tax=Mongoliibacter ruber TaxID=1750599 RepID=A0A2T0WSJ5_9BACT|nr:hypothetical protein [Mongoliibacter ruber]PRY89660.1 hypothetical protein CLW00_102136 [Mongoliibacter ruber]
MKDSLNAIIRILSFSVFCLFIQKTQAQTFALDHAEDRKTKVSIVGDKFFINGTPTYQGRFWSTSDGQEYPIEGLLFNSRMVQGVFDDLNPKTRSQWAYPDIEAWDPDRNTEEFVQAMASWRVHGLLGFTLNLQGGCPYGYCNTFPWDNSAFESDGSLRAAFMQRTERILNRADELGMVVILGLFYFGEDQNLADETAINNAVKNAVEWVLEKGFTNVIIEINNECSVGSYDHAILKCDRVHELITMAKQITRDGASLYVSTSLAGGHIPTDKIVEASDFILIHGNGVNDPSRITEISEEIRKKSVYSSKPLVNNEDDIPWKNTDQGWEEQGNNFVSSVKSFTSWGFFDFRQPNENLDYNLGFQGVPVNWQISSPRKRDFFRLLSDITGSEGSPSLELVFSKEIGNVISVNIEGGPKEIKVNKFECIVNNRSVLSAEKILEEIDFKGFANDVLSQNHWIKVRLTYVWDEKEVVVESPYYRNPWWPYGGFSKD